MEDPSLQMEINEAMRALRYDLTFFQLLDSVVQMEPWIQRDRAMIDGLKSLGIEKGTV